MDNKYRFNNKTKYYANISKFSKISKKKLSKSN